MTIDNTEDRGETFRRTVLGGVAGLTASGVVGSAAASADEHAHEDDDRGRKEGANGEDGHRGELELNRDIVVDSRGEPVGDAPGQGTELFDPEPEFPPFVMHDPDEVEAGSPEDRYLRAHGASNLLHSRRAVVHPEDAGSGPVTWADYETPELGDVTVEPSGEGGSSVTIELEGLIPYGVYTFWAVHEPAYHRPLGGNDGQNNVVRADENGRATLSVVDEPDELTLPPGATVDETDEPIPITETPLHEVEGGMIVGAYHYDDRTWGPQPGPYMLTQFSVPL